MCMYHCALRYKEAIYGMLYEISTTELQIYNISYRQQTREAMVSNQYTEDDL